MEINPNVGLTNIPLKTDSGVASNVTTQVAAPMPQNIPIPAEVEMLRAVFSFDKLGEVLALFGMKPTPENRMLAQTLIGLNQPVTPENLARLNQSARLSGGDMGRAGFLFVNQPVTSANAAAVEGYAARTTSLTAQLNTLANALEGISEPAVRAALLEVLDTPIVVKQDGTIPTNGMNSAEIQISVEEMPTAQTTQAVSNPSENVNLQQQAFEADTALQAKTQATDVPQQQNPVSVTASETNLPQQTAPPTQTEKVAQTQTIPTPTESTARPESLSEQPKIAPRAESQHLMPLTEKRVTGIAERVIARLFPEPTALKTPEALDERLNDIQKTVTKLKAILEAAPPSAQSKEALQAADDATNNLKFLNDLKQSLYIQIPLNIAQTPVNAELYVFRGKQSRTPKSAQTALLALDLANLGHLEAYIQRSGQVINCQFRLEDEFVIDLVEQNIPRLAELLGSHGFSLAQAACIQLDENFSILSKEPEPFGAQTAVHQTHSVDVRT